MLEVADTFGWWDTKDELFSFIKKQSKEYLEKSWKKKRSILQNLASFEKYKSEIRRKFLEMIGGLPEAKPPLNAQFLGEIEEGNHIIRKVIFESLPQFYVTANLYIPKEFDGKLPAVLLCCGHVKDGKGYSVYRKVAVDLVENGFIVLFFDPLGQGERIGYWNFEKEKPIRWGSQEHEYDGLRCYLLGENIARYFIWDGIRALDFLCSLPEVDKTNIGVTGHSGGAIQTSYLMMVDGRVKASLPYSCFITTSYHHYLCTTNCIDAEQTLYKSVKYGIDSEDFYFSFSPRPVLIGIHRYDYHPIEGSYITFQRAKMAYQLYNKEENIRLVISPTEHDHDGYDRKMRKVCVEWFSKHLKGKEIKFKEKEIELIPQEKLLCLPRGHVRKSLPRGRMVYELLKEKTQKTRGKKDSSKEIRKQLVNLLGLREKKTLFHPRIRELNDIKLDQKAIRQKYIFFFTEKDMVCAGMFYHPEIYEDVIFLLLERGTISIPQEEKTIIDFLKEEKAVFIFEPRGIGNLESRKLSNDTEFLLATYSLTLGYPLIGMRVWDILQGIKFIKEYTRKNVSLITKGRYTSLYGLFAGILEEGLKGVSILGMRDSFSRIIEEKSYDFHLKGIIPGILMYFDTDDLVPLVGKIQATGKGG